MWTLLCDVRTDGHRKLHTGQKFSSSVEKEAALRAENPSDAKVLYVIKVCLKNLVRAKKLVRAKTQKLDFHSEQLIL